jgi:ankyrin repeat protein
LQYAINWPDVNLVKLLLDKGANVNLADEGRTTALIHATRAKRVVAMLTKAGAKE